MTTRFWLVMLIALLFTPATPAAMEPTAAYNQTDCLACHQQQNPALVQAWRESAHSQTQPIAECVSCHGNQHQDSLARARQDQTCLHCHGKDTPLAHSYQTSKHGVIVQLEQLNHTMQQPLQGANYRAPNCAYCHVYGGNHQPALRSDKTDDPAGVVPQSMRTVCQNCHSARYITTLFNNGEAMLEIGRMKLREAQQLITEAQLQFTPQQRATAETVYQDMAQHLRNVLLGIGHQSPDYQWWHGQPALDGDLLRIKGILGLSPNESAK